MEAEETQGKRGKERQTVVVEDGENKGDAYENMLGG